MGVKTKDVVARGLAAPEGPVLLPDGHVVFVEEMSGSISLFDGTEVRSIFQGPGSPNAVTLGTDGHFYFAQNGGVVGTWRAACPAIPGIQRIGPDGKVSYVATNIADFPIKAPNDLVFGPDGRLYFTDPAEPYDPTNRLEDGRLFAVGTSGDEMLLDVGKSYPNGLAFLPDGRLVWVETYERNVCILEEGRRRLLCQLPEGHLPDGLDVALDGRMYITTVTSHGLTVVSPEGAILEVIRLDSDALPTNCCFDGNALWVTDFGEGWADRVTTGRLWRVETDAQGKPQTPGRI